MKSFKDLAKSIENLPWIVRLILVLCLGIYGNLIRLFRSLGNKNVIGIILSVILLCFLGLFIFWIIDVICVILDKKIWWID